jgi:tRNA C32,U32 (ribose-2'-O)-methylase TrmJ
MRRCHRREESGLTDAELALCSHSCAIPSGRLQPSLNLAAAVAVVLAQCYEMRTMPQPWAQHYPVDSPASLERSTLRRSDASAVASRGQGWDENDWLLTACDPAAPAGGLKDNGRTRLEAMMSPAPASEIESLLQRWSALVRRAGLTDAESIAGWQGSHGRKRRTVGHIRAVLSRARVTQKASRVSSAIRRF